jgi:hypothetical protein
MAGGLQELYMLTVFSAIIMVEVIELATSILQASPYVFVHSLKLFLGSSNIPSLQFKLYTAILMILVTYEFILVFLIRK